ncbi:PREDICTED: beta-hexosaminidase 1-like [Fragaria vesca subsp. vesca]
MKQKKGSYDISKVRVVVQSASEDLTLGVDESYTLFVLRKDGKAIVGEATIEVSLCCNLLLLIRRLMGWFCFIKRLSFS